MAHFTDVTDPHADIDDLVFRARMLLGSGLTSQECLAHLRGSDPFPPDGDCFLAVKAAQILDRDQP